MDVPKSAEDATAGDTVIMENPRRRDTPEPSCPIDDEPTVAQPRPNAPSP
jgi:hypothetical protein